MNEWKFIIALWRQISFGCDLEDWVGSMYAAIPFREVTKTQKC